MKNSSLPCWHSCSPQPFVQLAACGGKDDDVTTTAEATTPKGYHCRAPPWRVNHRRGLYGRERHHRRSHHRRGRHHARSHRSRQPADQGRNFGRVYRCDEQNQAEQARIYAERMAGTAPGTDKDSLRGHGSKGYRRVASACRKIYDLGRARSESQGRGHEQLSAQRLLQGVSVDECERGKVRKV